MPDDSDVPVGLRTTHPASHRTQGWPSCFRIHCSWKVSSSAISSPRLSPWKPWGIQDPQREPVSPLMFIYCHLVVSFFSRSLSHKDTSAVAERFKGMPEPQAILLFGHFLLTRYSMISSPRLPTSSWFYLVRQPRVKLDPGPKLRTRMIALQVQESAWSTWLSLVPVM